MTTTTTENALTATSISKMILDLLKSNTAEEVAKRLNQKNIPSSRGGKWTAGRVRAVAALVEPS